MTLSFAVTLGMKLHLLNYSFSCSGCNAAHISKTERALYGETAERTSIEREDARCNNFCNCVILTCHICV